MKVYVVCEEYSAALEKVFASREAAEAYVEAQQYDYYVQEVEVE